MAFLNNCCRCDEYSSEFPPPSYPPSSLPPPPPSVSLPSYSVLNPVLCCSVLPVRYTLTVNAFSSILDGIPAYNDFTTAWASLNGTFTLVYGGTPGVGSPGCQSTVFNPNQVHTWFSVEKWEVGEIGNSGEISKYCISISAVPDNTNTCFFALGTNRPYIGRFGTFPSMVPVIGGNLLYRSDKTPARVSWVEKSPPEVCLFNLFFNYNSYDFYPDNIYRAIGPLLITPG